MPSLPLPVAGDPPPPARQAEPAPILALGFRPFFIAALGFGAVAMIAWVLALHGAVHPGTRALSGGLWHAHEMIFGYALAVVAGFLFTAARNWTGRATPAGGRLLAIVLLWLVGRIAVSGIVELPGAATAALSLLFPVALWVGVASVLIPARSRRNYGILALLAALAALQTTVHLAALSGAHAVARGALFGAMHLVLVLHVVISGRVVPMFTENALLARGLGPLPAPRPGAIAPLILVRLGVVASVATGALAASAAAGNPSAQLPLAAVAGSAAAIHLARMWRWRTVAAMRLPMVAVLHVGHLWIVAGYALLTWSAASGDPAAPEATHAFTVGVFGTFTLGMMTRVSLGHTGRPIEATPRIGIAFLLVGAAAALRVGGLLVAPGAGSVTRTAPAVLFAAALLLLLTALAPILAQPRPDGRPG